MSTLPAQIPYPPAPRRSYQLARVLLGLLWIAASGALAGRAGQGIANRLNQPVLEAVLEQAFFLFLLLVGFQCIAQILVRTPTPLRLTNALPGRATAPQEFQRGAALGWAMLLVVLLPMMLTGSLHPAFAPGWQPWALSTLSLLRLALATLALEVAFRGYLFRTLVDAIGAVPATLLLSLAYALASSQRPYANAASLTVTFLTGVLFSIAYLRTHALWLGWGLHFAWDAAMGVLAGLPIAGYLPDHSPLLTTVTGPAWLTGGLYGPEAAGFTLLVLLAALPVLYRITRDYAWAYTHPEILPMGVAVHIAPPAAHAAMEAAPAPAPLVQILGATPAAASTLPVIEEHLRSARALPEEPAPVEPPHPV